MRTCRLGKSGLEEEMAWIERYRQLWAARFDELDKIVAAFPGHVVGSRPVHADVVSLIQRAVDKRGASLPM